MSWADQHYSCESFSAIELYATKCLSGVNPRDWAKDPISLLV